MLNTWLRIGAMCLSLFLLLGAITYAATGIAWWSYGQMTEGRAFLLFLVHVAGIASWPIIWANVSKDRSRR